MIQDLLVGSTGFVGGNLLRSHSFSGAVHSSDIETAFDSRPELCVYAGVPAAMFLANSAPEKDLAVMAAARENLRRIAPQKTVLISSIAVYADSRGKNEESPMEAGSLSAYGANRLQLEKWVREDHPDCLIVRLPALYGEGLKKNFIYDMLTVTPAMLRPDKYEQLSAKSRAVAEGYSLADNGFYKKNGRVSETELRRFFENNGFNALSFTDSRSRYQFYDLSRLWSDIQRALQNDLRVLNLTTPPVTASEVYRYLNQKDWKNELDKAPFDYDLHSLYAEKLGGSGNYLCTEAEELESIRRFYESHKQ